MKKRLLVSPTEDSQGEEAPDDTIDREIFDEDDDSDQETIDEDISKISSAVTKMNSNDEANKKIKKPAASRKSTRSKKNASKTKPFVAV